MLALAFQVGGQRYLLSCRDVVEVVPMTRVRAVPTAPAQVAGLFVYRGASTPVIDLCIQITGKPAARLMSTRIVMVRVRERLLGLIAERVTEAISITEASLEPIGMTLEGAPWLGRVRRDDDGLAQLVEPAALLDEALERLLYAEATA